MNFLEHLTQFFNEFGLYATDFYNFFIEKFLVYPILLTILGIYLLSLVLSKFKFISKNKSTSFKVYKSCFISSLLIATIIFCIAIYAWVIDFKGVFDTSFRFTFLLSLIVSFSFALIKYLQLSNLYKRNSLKNITIQPITHISENQKYLSLKKRFEKFKCWLLVPALSFLLLFLLQEKHALVSIVIDASGSMKDGRLDAGKAGLIKTLGKVNTETTDFIFSVTPHENEKKCPSYTSLSNILQVTNPNDLCSYTYSPLVNESPISVINDITYYQGINSNWGFIVNSLWQNFLISKQFEEDNQKEYDKKIMIVASDFSDSDFKESLNSFFDTEICDEKYGFTEFYNEYAFMINLNQERETFVTKFEECYPNSIYDGYDVEEYGSAIDEIFENLKSKTWYYIIWLVTFYIIFSLIILLINPKKLNAI